MLKFMANFRFHPKIGVAYIKMELLIKENVYAGKGSLNNYVTQKHFHPNHHAKTIENVSPICYVIIE